MHLGFVLNVNEFNYIFTELLILEITYSEVDGANTMQLVVVIAVRNAVRAATIIFTEISIRRDFFIIQFVLN